jgi:hypothetical protein
MYADDGTTEAVSAVLDGPYPPARHPFGEPGTTDPEKLPHSHRCGTRWNGKGVSHCGACCVTFTGVSTFDLHRRNGRCVHPSTIGLVLVPGRAYEVWGNIGAPADDEEHVD